MELLSGNEAIAQGAWEAGAHIGAAYPGTPSTETMEAFAAKSGVYAEWSPNEKVALEVGIGASCAGARVLSTMKHVGVNVAADPLFTAAYTGVGGGLVILAADDPGMHSSQNEQDSRFYALAAHVPMFEPACSQEALDHTKAAFELSERFNIPFFIRSTVRISHTKTPVITGPRKQVEVRPYKKDIKSWVMMPAFAKGRRLDLDRRLEKLGQWVEHCEYNEVHKGSTEIGIICAGAVYQYVKEAMPQASIFKLGISYPLPKNALRDFANSVQNCYVVEEASDYFSTQIAALGIRLSQVPGTALPIYGELNPRLISQAFGIEVPQHESAMEGIPMRPPALCRGCPHIHVFEEFNRIGAIVTGDIGCYTLGALPPYSGMDTVVDMGASISMAHGFELAMKGARHKPVIGVIGDSTFAHSGITSLMNTVYNQGCGTICILDNRTTGMTGQQGNPFNGITLQNRPTVEMDIEKIVAAIGVEHIQTVNPNKVSDVRESIANAVSYEGISVVVFRSPCVLLKGDKKPQAKPAKTCIYAGNREGGNCE